MKEISKLISFLFTFLFSQALQEETTASDLQTILLQLGLPDVFSLPQLRRVHSLRALWISRQFDQGYR